jgi:peptide deformylase
MRFEETVSHVGPSVNHYPKLSGLHILHYPDAKLRERARRIKEVGSFLPEMSERMAELLRDAQGIGLAATQVGWPYRLVVLKSNPESDEVQALVNPASVVREGRVVEEEGCLSVPGVFAKVRRAEKVRVRAELPDGTPVEMELEGLMARAWQHETDHLDGTLFVDRLSPVAKIAVSGRLRELERIYRECCMAEGGPGEKL